jgi:hypothetical protein
MEEINQELALNIWCYNSKNGKLYWKINKFRARKGHEAGNIKPDGYVQVIYNYKYYYAHRLIWLMEYGEWPENFIDHIDHDRSNNKIENLRSVTHLQNVKNSNRSINNNSGFTGVCWDDKNNKWRSFINNEGNRIHLGRFLSFEEAVRARIEAEALYGYHENHGT